MNLRFEKFKAFRQRLQNGYRNGYKKTLVSPYKLICYILLYFVTICNRIYSITVLLLTLCYMYIYGADIQKNGNKWLQNVSLYHITTYEFSKRLQNYY